MKNLFSIFCLMIFLSGGQLSAQSISSPSASYTVSTAYTNGDPNDVIYGFCSPDANGNPVTGSLTATAGLSNCTFIWDVFNSATNSYSPYTTQTGVSSSTITGLANGGYHVTIKNSGGSVVFCNLAWVWINQLTADVAPIAAGCSPFTLSGTANGSNYTYYNPPAEPLNVSATTTVSVNFSATHTYDSDLGFFLVGPASCGSPTITLSPNPGANGEGSVCNSGDNVSNLIFTNFGGGNFDPCVAATPYTGTYSSYGPAGSPTTINWSGIYGCNAASGGWSVQIYDCIGADVGALTHATISFNGNSGCGPSSVTYDSGPINSAINDNSCSSATASIYTVPNNNSTPIVLTNSNAVTYQWTSNPSSTIPNSTSSLTPSINPNPTVDTWYYLTVTSAYGCSTKDSAFYDYTPSGVPSITPAGPFCLNSAATNLSATPTGGTWSGTGITNATNGTFDPATAGTGTFTITYTTTGACGASTTANVVVNALPTVTVPTNTTVCANTAVPAANFTTSPSGGTVTWTNNNPGIGLAASGSGNIASFIAVNSGSTVQTAVVTVTPTVNGCQGTPSSYTITVNPIPTLSAVTSQTVCNNTSTAAINFSTSPAGATVNWTNSNTAIGESASGTGNIVSFNATNTTSAQISGNFSATPIASGCTGSAVTFTINVNPTPSLSAVTSQTVCPDANTSPVMFTSNPTGASVDWINSNTSIGAAASGTGNISAFAGTNSTSAQVSGNFSATPTLSGCIGSPVTFTITVNPLVSTNAIADVTACNTDNVPASSFSSTPSGATYTWTNDQTSIGLAASGSNDYSAFVANNLTTNPVVATVVVSPMLNGCTGTPATFHITINPTPGPPTVSNISYCMNDASSALTATASPGGTLNWWGTSPAGGTSSPSGPVPSTASVSTTNYYVSQVVLGCESPRAQLQVTVNTVPSLTNPGDTTVCAGDMIPVRNITSTPTGAAIAWSNSNTGIGLAASGTGNVSSFTAINAGTSAVTSTVILVPTMGNCVGAPINYTITVNPLPTAIVSNTTACNTASVGAINWTSNPPGSTYTWTNNNPSIGVAASGATNIPAFTASNNGSSAALAQVNVTATLNGCTGPATTFTITINPTPVAPVVANIGYCLGDVSVPLTATGNSLLWYSAPTGGFGSVGAFTPATSSVGTVDYYVTQTILGCESPRAALAVSTHALPNATVKPITSSCPPLCTDVILVSSDTLINYAWQMGDGTSMTGNDTIYNYCYSQTGTYPINVVITDHNGCKQTITGASATVYPYPDPDFTFDPQPASILEPTIYFYDQSSGSQPMTNMWDFGDTLGMAINTTNPVYEYHGAGNFPVKLVVANSYGCLDSIYKTVVIEKDYVLYIPNAFSPNNDGVNDTFIPKGFGVSEKGYKFYIFDRWGNMIFFTEDLTKGWDGVVTGHSAVVTQDTYVWKLLAKSEAGKKIERVGHVTVVK